MAIDQILDAGAPPIIAILRGVAPAEVVGIGAALIEAGIRMIEVPLNSPEPLVSIARLQAEFGDRVLIGAGTVLDAASVDALAATGAGLVVAPNTDRAVIARALELGLEVVPGFLTPSEAFAAIAAGARKLKLFPASAHGPRYLAALREVLPADVATWAVGGVDAGNAREWLDAGAEGVALGGALYRPGRSAAAVREAAAHAIAAIA
ncbi:MAG TPA: 2-dehydro-3-deoxy-6-phosphogalactonate aldolase [Croceibacterium sp.]|nr:2-dehydro-3-deoxy-6-phosphogalactonate aldolase [Croceibacterium sp.]